MDIEAQLVPVDPVTRKEHAQRLRTLLLRGAIRLSSSGYPQPHPHGSASESLPLVSSE